MVGVFGNEYLQKVLHECGIPYWDLRLMGCTILQGDYDGVLIDCGNHAIRLVLKLRHLCMQNIFGDVCVAWTWLI